MPTGGIRWRITRSVLRVCPAKVSVGLGEWLLGQRRFAEALESYTLADRKYSNRFGATGALAVSARAQRAWCLMKLGRLDEASAEYESAISAKETNGDRFPPTASKLREYLEDVQKQRAAQAGGELGSSRR
jgi:tetratricopeptide (TPR) repeat protein